MFCPHCGSFRENEHAVFCPVCGHKLGAGSAPIPPWHESSNGQHSRDTIPHSKKKSKTNIMIAAIVVLVLIVVALSGMVDVTGPNNSSERTSIETLADGTYFEYGGDFIPDRGIFTVSLIDGNRIAFALNDDLSLKYDYYTWTLLDRDHVSSTSTIRYSKYVGDVISKTEPVLYYLNQKIGEYDISVKCYVQSGEEMVPSAVYSGKVIYGGTITKEYSWKYQGVEYSAATSFSYSDYCKYRDINPKYKWVTESRYRDVAGFVTYKEPAIAEMAESLRESYGAGHSTFDQNFASFVLAFVQICFKYPPNSSLMDGDLYQYGQNEYFAYPLETLFYSMGDCEDTSILAAALFKALGYGAGLIILPGHVLAAVGLDHYEPGNYSTRSYEILSQKVGDMIYYACETTAVTPIGLVTSSGYDGLPYSQYIGKQRYGFYLV